MSTTTPNGYSGHAGYNAQDQNGQLDISDKELERGPSNQSHISHEEKLRNMLTNTMTLSPETFEQMYLAPKNKISGDLRKTFGNPTPIALLGFSVGLMPLSAAFMGWRGAGGFAVASTTCSLWFGGVLLILAGIGEFLLGNSFPMMVFIGYGAHFLTFATLFIPWFNAIGFFAPETAMTPEGMGTPVAGQTATFAASFGFYPLAMAMLSFIYLIGSLRTNLVFVLIFVVATMGFGFGTGAYWQIAQGNMAYGLKLAQGLGGCFFVAGILGWYLLLAQVIIMMELPIPDLPVFDLSTVIKARPRGRPREKQE